MFRTCACLKPHSHCPRFQSPRCYGVDTGAHWDHAVVTPASTALNWDTPCWTGVHRNVAPVVSTFLKPLGLTERNRLQNNASLFGASPKLFRHEPHLHCKTTGRNRSKPAWAVSTVDTVTPGVSRRRAGVAPTLAGQTTVWHSSSRWYR